MKWEQEDLDLLAIPEALPEGFYQDARRQSIVKRGLRFFSGLLRKFQEPEAPLATVTDINEWREKRIRERWSDPI